MRFLARFLVLILAATVFVACSDDDAALDPGTTSKPTFSPAAGSYDWSVSVTLATVTPGATVYYTTNGVDPTTASAVYSNALVLTNSRTVKAMATAPGLKDSAVSSATYTITQTDSKVVIAFHNGYADFAGPQCLFYKSGSAAVALASASNAGGIWYYATNIRNAGTYGFSLRRDASRTEATVVGAYANGNSIADTGFIRTFTVAAGATGLKPVHALSWNRQVFLTDPASKLAVAPYNLTNAFGPSYKLPGCTDLGGGNYLFSIFSPKSSRVQLLGSITTWATGSAPDLQYDHTSGYWWIVRSSGVAPGGKYKFFLDSATYLADPYARTAIDNDNDNSGVVDTAYAWGDGSWTRPARQDLVIYEVNVRDMSLGDTSVLLARRGRFLGFIDKIPYLKSLGVNSVELMPVMERATTGYTWGYDNAENFAPENGLGTSANDGSAYGELKQLVDALHQNGIAVILDVQYNHSGGGNNNLYVSDSGYYYNGDTSWGSKTEMRNTMAQKYFVDNMKYWFDEFHVDGLRFDSTENIDGAAMRSMVKRLTDNGYGDRYYIFEEFNGGNNTAIQSFNTANGDLIASWGTGFKDKIWKAIGNWNNGADSYTGMGDATYHGNSGGWTRPAWAINYASSHDEGNLGSGRFSFTKQQVKLEAAHLLTCMGIPMIWQGDEFMRDQRGNHSADGNNTADYNNVINWTLPATHSDLTNYYANLVKLRIAHPTLRQNVTAPAGWSWGDTAWSTGELMYMYQGVAGDNDFVVFINYSTAAASYDNVTFPQTGNWYLMCDGASATAAAPGLSTLNVTGPTTVAVPSRTARVYMSQATR